MITTGDRPGSYRQMSVKSESSDKDPGFALTRDLYLRVQGATQVFVMDVMRLKLTRSAVRVRQVGHFRRA